MRSLVASPLMIESEVFGVLLIATRQRPDAFTSDDCEFLRQLSSHVALAAHQARLYGALQGAYQDLRETQQTVMQQERLRALGQIASGIAHDINNALSPAALYTQSMLSHEPNLTDRSREQLAVIQRAIDDVARTVQRMRAFYMPRGLELTLAPVDLNQSVMQVIDLTRARWSNIPQERGVVMKVETESGTRSAGDPRRGERVARRVDQPAAERRRRDARGRHHRRCARASWPRDDQVVVEVQDNGIGMSETTRSRCLEPFFTTKGERGTGLGLPMVFGMVQRHGGDLEIDSELGRGTTMRLIFPRAPTGMTVARTAARRTAEAAAPAADRRRSAAAAFSLRDALELDEHEVVTADGGQAGIDAFALAVKAGDHFRRGDHRSRHALCRRTQGGDAHPPALGARFPSSCSRAGDIG